MSVLSFVLRRLRAAIPGVLAVAGWVPMASLHAADEVPFITTPDHVTLAMLELARVGPDDLLVDLGSGDGRIVITAARRFGARGLGVEIVPELVARSIVNARQAGVADRTEFRVQDLFHTDLSRASVVTMYLLPEVNLALRPRLEQLTPGTRIVSHDWDLGDWLPDESRTLDVPDKPVGREKLSRLYLWVVPARVEGLWCGIGDGRGLTLSLRQRHQVFDATLGREGRAALGLVGRIHGRWLAALQAGSGADGTWRWLLEGGQLHLLHSGDAAWAPTGLRFERAGGAGCSAP